MTVPQQQGRGAPAGALAEVVEPALTVNGGPLVSTPDDCTLAALRTLLRSTHLAGPDDLPALVSAAGQQLGADRAVLHLVDYDQVQLIALAPNGASSAQPLPIEATLAGRAFSDLAQYTSTAGPGVTLWTPVLDGTERLGVLELRFAAAAAVDDELRAAGQDLASLLAALVIAKSLYGDAIERARRRTPLTVPAELQWRLLPPLTFVSPRVAVAGVLAPAGEVAGDSFDYALNGYTLHVAVVDAMGHGLEATLLSAVAVAALRNARRGGLDLAGTVAAMDAEIASQFGPDKFVTGIVGQLDLATGWWRWTTCGHPPALLVRAGRVVKTLDSVIGAPLGLGLLEQHPEIGQERLEPGDRLLIYTDGVTEARDAAGEFFGTERLVRFVTRHTASGQPAAETLRRLNRTILAHQNGALQDDATTVLVEWHTDEPDRVILLP